MGQTIIQNDTTKNPLQLIGRESGICWNADINNIEKNIQRAKDCINSDHGRVMEFPQVYMVLDNYSARVIREFYTHIGGMSTRLQASTRYIDYESGFEFVTPPSIERNAKAKKIYNDAMDQILNGLQLLDMEGIPKEDCAMLLPLGMCTKVVCRTNFRNLVDMSRQRMCTRAYYEFRLLFNDIYKALMDYSPEWKWLVETCFMPKCKAVGFCNEKKSCGKMPKKESMM